MKIGIRDNRSSREVTFDFGVKKYTFTMGDFSVSLRGDNFYIRDSTKNIKFSYKDIITSQSLTELYNQLNTWSLLRYSEASDDDTTCDIVIPVSGGTFLDPAPEVVIDAGTFLVPKEGFVFNFGTW
jgi:hypothetical protein